MAELVPSSIATWKPFSGKGHTPLRRDIICLHTMVGSLPGSWSWASGAGRAYWHFGVGGDGQCWQCQDLRYRSASNLDGNPYVIPIECADMGPGFGGWNGQCGHVPPFTQAQVDKLVDLIAWLCQRYNIPAQIVPDSQAGRRGIAWHRQGIPGSPDWHGGLRWSSSAGKCCPDGARVAQIRGVIVPRVRAKLFGTPQPPPKEEDDMPYSIEQLNLIVQDAVRDAISVVMGQPGVAVPALRKRIYDELADQAEDPNSPLRRAIRAEK